MLGVARSRAWRLANQRRLHREFVALIEQDRYCKRAVELQTQLAKEDGLGRAIEAVNRAVAWKPASACRAVKVEVSGVPQSPGTETVIARS